MTAPGITPQKHAISKLILYQKPNQINNVGGLCDFEEQRETLSAAYLYSRVYVNGDSLINTKFF